MAHITYFVICNSDNVVGVIVKVEIGSFKLLTTNGVVKSIRLQDIARKYSNRSITGLDCNGQTVHKISQNVVLLLYSTRLHFVFHGNSCNWMMW